MATSDSLIFSWVAMELKKKWARGTNTAVSGGLLSNLVCRSLSLFSNLLGRDEVSWKMMVSRILMKSVRVYNT